MSADLKCRRTQTVRTQRTRVRLCLEQLHQNEAWEPKIIAFLCNWCSYAGADLAGISRIQYPPNVRVVRVPCSGRVNPLYIIKALQHGADGVLVSGCHPGDCHYISGNYYARRRFTLLKSLLEAVGIEAGPGQLLLGVGCRGRKVFPGGDTGGRDDQGARSGPASGQGRTGRTSHGACADKWGVRRKG